MKDRVCLVTGGSSGIGRATALALAGMGATVLITGRDQQRLDQAQAGIIYQTNNPKVYALKADLASQEQVRCLAGEVLARFARLHVLVNNAGLASPTRQITPDGLELTFAVNHLAPFLLTNLLHGRMKSNAPARIVTVSSIVQRWGRIHLDDLQLTQHYTIDAAYNQSKAANVLFTYELARRLSGTGVTATCLEPGQTRTGFSDTWPGLKGWLARHIVLPLTAQTADKGAQTVVYLASSPEVEGVSGGYFVRQRPARSAAFTYDEELARNLWDVSCQLTAIPAAE